MPIIYSGDVIPVDVVGPGTSGEVVITTDGNTIGTSLIDGDPDGGGQGQAWDADEVWRNYEWDVPVEVGKTYHGAVRITAGSQMRVLDVHLGRDGQGALTVTGEGSTLNLYRPAIPTSAVYTFNKGTDYDYPSGGSFPPDGSFDRDTDGDLYVGVNGHGHLRANSGGKVEVGLTLEVAQNARGTGIIELEDYETTMIVYGATANVNGGGVLIIRSAATFVARGALTIDGRLMLGDATLRADTGLLGATSRTVVEAGRSADLFSPEESTARADTTGWLDEPGCVWANLGRVLIEEGAELRLAQVLADLPPVNGYQRGATDDQGVIELRGGTLTADAGLKNYGVMGFTAGSSVVHGPIENVGLSAVAADPNASPPVEASAEHQGVILIGGDDVSVTFTGPVQNDGMIAVAPGARVNFLRGVQGNQPVYLAEGCPAPTAIGVTAGQVTFNGGEVAGLSNAVGVQP